MKTAGPADIGELFSQCHSNNSLLRLHLQSRSKLLRRFPFSQQVTTNKTCHALQGTGKKINYQAYCPVVRLWLQRLLEMR